jgi:Rrf2 family protein
MILTQESYYALHTLFDLSARSGTDLATVASIAQRQQIPRKFLALILSRLKVGGLVEARRGVDGGYRLARPPEEITVGEVLKLTERRKPANRIRFDGLSGLVETSGLGRGSDNQ